MHHVQCWAILVVFFLCVIHIFQKREVTPLVPCLNERDGRKHCSQDEKLSLETFPTHFLGAIFQMRMVKFSCIWNENTKGILECLCTFPNGILPLLVKEVCRHRIGLLVWFSLYNNRGHWLQVQRLCAINTDSSCCSTLCSANRTRLRGRQVSRCFGLFIGHKKQHVASQRLIEFLQLFAWLY